MADYNLGTAHGQIKIDADTSGVTQAEQAMGGLAKKGDSTSAAVQKVGTTMGVAGAVIAGGLGLATKTAADFEQGLSGIRAVSGATASDMDKVRDMALRIGKDTAFSASEASSAIEELVKAGISIPDVLNGAADATVALAAATGVDMPTAAAIASNAMNVFGIGANEMDRVVNGFAQTANASAIDVTDLGMSMSAVGAVAALAGMSMEDTTKAIGQLGDAGIKGSDAGTSLKTMLMNLQPTTKAQSEAFRDLGIITEDGTNKFFEANGEMKSLRDIQELLKTGTEGMTDAQKTMALEMAFGSDAIRAAAVLADGGAASYDAFGKKMEASGTAADQAKIRQDNFNGSFEQFKGAVETAAIVIGSVLLPVLTDFVNWLGGLVDKFAELSPGMQKFITFAAAGAAGLLLMGAAVIKTVQFAQQLTGAVNTIITALFRKNAAETASAASSSRSALASTGAWLAHAGRVAAIWVGQAAVASANAIKIAAIWIAETTRAVVATVAQWVIMGTQAALNAAKVAAAWLVSHGTALVTAMASMAVAVASTVAGWVLMGVQSMIQAARMAAAWLIAMGPVGWIIAAVIALVALIIANWDTVKAATVAVWNAIWGAIQAAWEGIKTAFSAALGFIVGLIEMYLNMWKTIITTAMNVIQAVFSTIWNAIKAVISAVWNGIVAVVTGAINTARNVISSVMNAISSLMSGVWNTIKGIASSVWNSIIGVVQGAINGVIGVVRGLPGQITGIFSNAGNLLLDVGKRIIQGLINGIKSAIQGVKNVLSSVTGLIPDWKGPARVDAKLLRGNGQLIMESLVDGFESRFGDVKSTLEGLTSNLGSHVSVGMSQGGPDAFWDASALAPGYVPPSREVSSYAASQGEAATGEVKYEFNTYNPVAERASDSEARRLRALASLGAF